MGEKGRKENEGEYQLRSFRQAGKTTRERTGVFDTISIRFAPFVHVVGSSQRTGSEGAAMAVASAGEPVTLQRKL
jgi:hypothetical protein